MAKKQSTSRQIPQKNTSFFSSVRSVPMDYTHRTSAVARIAQQGGNERKLNSPLDVAMTGAYRLL